MNSLRLALAFGGLALLTTNNSFAIGDSSGCRDFYHTKYLKPALFGTVEELKNSIEDTLDERERYVPTMTEKALFKISSSQHANWREKERRKILLDALPCSQTQPLIAFAVFTGNVEVIKFLLAAGASPNGSLPDWRPIFFDCGENASLSGSVKRDIKKTIAGLSVLLDHGGNLKFVASDGRTVLTNCRDLEILKFYISRGADPRLNLRLQNSDGYYTALSLAVEEAVWQHGIRKRISNDPMYNAYERVKLFIQVLGDNSIEGTKTEYHLRYRCAGIVDKEGCQEIAKIVKARPGVFEGQPEPRKP